MSTIIILIIIIIVIIIIIIIIIANYFEPYKFFPRIRNHRLNWEPRLRVELSFYLLKKIVSCLYR